ncbi:MAG: LysR family transcriptional regulator [Caldimonas sp.]
MKDLDLKTLRLFVAVCEQQNIARAAELEHIEPSAISKRIAQLEATLGTTLLVRARRGVQPTPAGLALIEHARTVLFTMDRIESDIAAFSGGLKGHVRMLASASAIAENLLDDVAAFMREPANRGIKVDIEERFSQDLLRSVRDGSASIGICWNRTAMEGVVQRPYRKDRLALAVHPDHALAHRKTLRFEQTLEWEHVGLPPSSAVHGLLQQAAAKAGHTLGYRVIVSNFDAAFRVVAANLAVSVVPSQVAAPRGVKVIPLSDPWARRTFAICCRENEALQPPAQRMVDYLVARAARGP